jgi:hypothetical protein
MSDPRWWFSPNVSLWASTVLAYSIVVCVLLIVVIFVDSKTINISLAVISGLGVLASGALLLYLKFNSYTIAARSAETGINAFLTNTNPDALNAELQQ